MLQSNMTVLAEKFGQDLEPDRVYTDYLRRVAWGTDASFYQKRPQIVIHPKNESEAAKALAQCYQANTPVTFRAAGTALCGQAISDSVLMVAGMHWDKFKVLEGGKKVQMQPGVIGSKINQALAPLGWKFGPDPATIASAMAGGIVANNASGMNCGTHHNSYQLIDSGRIIFADGSILDTGSKQSRESFKQHHPEMIKGIEAIRDEILADKEMVARIKRKYSIKNVTGFGMNSFVDSHDPIDIILRLMVGSEGALGFLSEITMKSVVKNSHSASAMVYFDSLRGACEAIVELRQKAFSETNAAELLDNPALKAVAASKYETPDFLGSVHKDVTAVLFETFGDNQAQIDANIAKMTDIMAKHGLYMDAEFTQDAATITNMWAIRKAIFPLAGSMRPAGTSCVIEDIAFPIEVLPQATIDLQNLSFEHGYSDGVIYGHALEGNYHVIFSQNFSTPEEIARFDRFMQAVVELVAVKYDGSLKAEHGTGFGMASFVEKEWGTPIYDLMKRVKKTLDPNGILNPGVIINDDPDCHAKGFKPLPQVHSIIDKCIECGFCEPHCVSHGLTLSPRQRTAIARVMKTLETTGEEPEVLAELKKNYPYFAIDTCAADGMCKLGCPMGIDTGKYVKVLRAEGASSLDKKISDFTADKFGSLESVARFALGATDITRKVIGESGMGAITKIVRKIAPSMPVPLWTEGMPTRGKALPSQTKLSKGELKAVYFPACLNRMMGTSAKHDDQRSIPDTINSLFNKAGVEMVCGEKPKGLCCGQPWESYGHDDAADRKSDELSDWLLQVSNNGEYPILVATTACLERMRRACDKRLKMYGPEEFAFEFLVERLQINKIVEKIVVHPTCTTRKLGMTGQLTDLARMCATEVIVPEKVGCCGMAGNRGMNYPELNEHALRHLKSETKDQGATHGYSVSATCDVGLTTHSGIPYKNILVLLDKASSKKS